MVPQALNDFRPNILANYLFELANSFHAFYEACPVLKSEEPARGSRLALCDLTRTSLGTGSRPPRDQSAGEDVTRFDLKRVILSGAKRSRRISRHHFGFRDGDSSTSLGMTGNSAVTPTHAAHSHLHVTGCNSIAGSLFRMRARSCPVRTRCGLVTCMHHRIFRRAQI